MKKLILILLLAIGLNAQVYDLLGTAQRIKDLDVRPSWVSFDGVDDYYSVADNDNLDFGTGDFSIEIWIKTKPTIDAKPIINKGNLGTGNFWYAIQLVSNTIQAYVADGSGSYWVSFTGISILPNSLNHIVLSLSRAGDQILYLNGVAVKTQSVSNSVDIVNSSKLTIGSRNLDIYSNLDLYLFRFFNRALTASEVTDLYNYGHPELYSLPYADRGASQTELASNGEDWTGVVANSTPPTGWVIGGGITTYSESGGVFTFVGNGVLTASTNQIRQDAVYFGKRFKVRVKVSADQPCDIYLRVGNTPGYAQDKSIGVDTNSSEYIWETNENLDAIVPSRFSFGGEVGRTYNIDYIRITQIGAVAEYYAHNASSYSWVDASGNNLHAQSSGSPTAVRSEKIGTIKQFKGSIAANTNTTLTSIIPKGYRIRAIRAVGSDSLTAIKIGTSSAGEEIVASTTTIGTTPKLLTLANTSNNAYSESADVTLYARHDTAASGKTMDLIFILEKVNK